MSEPTEALISREVIEQGESYIVIRETWNTKHPDCPFHLLPAGQNYSEVWWMRGELEAKP